MSGPPSPPTPAPPPLSPLGLSWEDDEEDGVGEEVVSPSEEFPPLILLVTPTRGAVGVGEAGGDDDEVGGVVRGSEVESATADTRLLLLTTPILATSVRKSKYLLSHASSLVV